MEEGGGNERGGRTGYNSAAQSCFGRKRRENMSGLGIAIIGAGRIGRMHAEVFAATPGAEVVGIVDRSRKDPEWPTRAGLDNAAVYASASEAFADKKAKAVVIATASDSHADLIRAAARANKKIFCEKPVAFSAAAIRDLQKDIGKTFLHVGFNRRFDPRYRKMRDLLAAGRLGRMYSYHIVNRDPKRPPPHFIGGSGGMLADFNVHDFDMLRFLSGGDIAEVYVRGAGLIPEVAAAGDIDTAIITAQMENGALASVCCSRETNYGHDQSVEALGEKGALRADNVLEAIPRHYHLEGITDPPPLPDFAARYRESFVAQARAFVAAAQGKNEPPPTALQNAARAVAAVEAGNESLKTNRPVKVAA